MGRCAIAHERRIRVKLPFIGICLPERQRIVNPHSQTSSGDSSMTTSGDIYAPEGSGKFTS